MSGFNEWLFFITTYNKGNHTIKFYKQHFEVFRAISLKFWWLFAPVIGIIAFLPSLNVYFSGEDFIFIFFASSGKPFYEVSQNLFYRPLPNLLWQFDYHLWGLSATGYHLTNIILHALNVFLIEILVFNIFRDKSKSLLTAFLFAIQPIHTEPVIWLAGRPDLLATLFFLIALITGMYFFRNKNWLCYLISVFSFTVSLFCKESGIGLPVILFFWVVILYKETLPILKLSFVAKFLPYTLVIGIYSLIRINVLSGIGGYSLSSSNIQNILWNLTIGFWFPLLFPINFESAKLVISAGLIFIFTIFYLWIGANLSFKALRSLTKYLFLILIFIYVNLLPVVTVSPVSKNLEQSRILYLPSIGCCILLAFIIPSKISNDKPSFITNLTLSKLLKFATTIKSIRIFLPILILGYIIALVIAYFPWLTAGTLVHNTLDLLEEANLPIRPGDAIYFEGVPDSLQGAYVWRNGLDEATKLKIGPKVEGLNHTEALIIDYRKAAQNKMWFVQYDWTPQATALKYGFSYSVSSPSEPSSLENQALIGKIWPFTQCDKNGWLWEAGINKIECQSSRGLLFNVTNREGDLILNSPIIQITHPKVYVTLENYVYYDFQQPVISSQLILSNVGGSPDFQRSFLFAADGKNHRYEFYISDLHISSKSEQIILKINRAHSSILWQNIAFYN